VPDAQNICCKFDHKGEKVELMSIRCVTGMLIYHTVYR